MGLFDGVLRLATFVVVFSARQANGSPLGTTATIGASINVLPVSLPGIQNVSADILPAIENVSADTEKFPNGNDSEIILDQTPVMKINTPELINFQLEDGKYSVQNQNVGILEAATTETIVGFPEMLDFHTEDGKNSVQINQNYDISLNRTKLMETIEAKAKSFPPTDDDFTENDHAVFKLQPSDGSIFSARKDSTFNPSGKIYENLNRNTVTVGTEIGSNINFKQLKKERPSLFVLVNSSKGVEKSDKNTAPVSNGSPTVENKRPNSNFNKFHEFKPSKSDQSNNEGLFTPQFRPSQYVNDINNNDRFDRLTPTVFNSYGEETLPYGIDDQPDRSQSNDGTNFGVASQDYPAATQENVDVKDTKTILRDLVQKLIRLDLKSTGSVSATHSLDIDGKLLHTAVALSYGRPFKHKITEIPVQSHSSDDIVNVNENDEKIVKKVVVNKNIVKEEDDKDGVQNDEGKISNEPAETEDRPTTTTKPASSSKPKPSWKPKPNSKPKRQNNKMAVKPMKPDKNGSKDRSEETGNRPQVDTSEPEEDYPIVKPIRTKKGTTTTTSRPMPEDDDDDSDERGSTTRRPSKVPIKVAHTSGSDSDASGGHSSSTGNKKPAIESEYSDESAEYANGIRPTVAHADQELAGSTPSFSKRKPTKTEVSPHKPEAFQETSDSSEEVDYYQNVPASTASVPDKQSSESSDEDDYSKPISHAETKPVPNNSASVSQLTSGNKDSGYSEEDSFEVGPHSVPPSKTQPKPPSSIASGSEEDFYSPGHQTPRPPPPKVTPFTQRPIFPTNRPIYPPFVSRSDESSSSSEEITTRKVIATTAPPTTVKAATTTVKPTTTAATTTTHKDDSSAESYEFISGESGSVEYDSGEDEYYYYYSGEDSAGSDYDRDISYSGSQDYSSEEYRQRKSQNLNATEIVDVEDGVSTDKRKSSIELGTDGKRGGMRRRRHRKGKKLHAGARQSKGIKIGGVGMKRKGVKRRGKSAKRSSRKLKSGDVKLNGNLDDLARISVVN